jgi:hypothetical protein
VVDILVLTGAVFLSTLLGWYLRGRRERKNRGVYLIYGIPLDAPDIDIPRRHDGRMPC